MSAPEPDTNYWTRFLAVVLRIGGSVELLAIFSVFLPRLWMEQAHESLGLGEMPRGVVVDFLIRQSSLYYAMHGLLLWFLASDPRRFQPIIRLMGWTFLLFGPAFCTINLTVGTPLWWALSDPAACALLGLLLLHGDRQLTRALG